MLCRKNAPRLSAKHTCIWLAQFWLLSRSKPTFLCRAQQFLSRRQSAAAAFRGCSCWRFLWAFRFSPTDGQIRKRQNLCSISDWQLLIIAYGIIFVPLLYIAAYYGGADVFLKAGVVSLGLFLGLTAIVFLTRKDFSFLGPILMIGGFVALGFIASGIIFGFSLGSVFAFAMVAFAGGAILYDTSNILHRYNTNQHVAASLALFASVALLFWYILQIFMGGGDD